MKDKVTILAIALAVSLGVNALQWRISGDLREMAGIACQAGAADFGMCARYALD